MLQLGGFLRPGKRGGSVSQSGEAAYNADEGQQTNTII